MQLPGGVQEARAPAERHGALGPLRQQLAKLGVRRQRQPIEIGLNGDVAVLRIDLRQELLDGGLQASTPCVPYAEIPSVWMSRLA